MESISAIGIFASLIYALLLINKKKKSISDKILTVWMFLFAIHLILPLMMALGNRFFIEKVDGLDIGLYTLHITFLYFYSLSLTENKLKFEVKHLLLLIPTITIYVVQKTVDAHVYLFSEIVEKFFFNDNVLFHLTGVVSLNLIFCIFFCNKFFHILKGHQKKMKNNFSYSEDIDLRWLKNLNIAALVLTFIVVFYLIALLNGKLNKEWLNNLYFSSISLFVVVLGYLGYKQGVILTYTEDKPTKKTQPDIKKQDKKQYNIKPLKDIKSPNEVAALIDLMEKEKPYLDPKLNIGSMANTLGIHAHQLSKSINQHFGQNFFEFVNNYRVEEYKKLVTNPKNIHFSILGLALDAGFNSKATFNRIFKNSTGLTPSEFRNQYKF